MAQIKVTAGPGRIVPVPAALGTAPGARQLLLNADADGSRPEHSRELLVEESEIFTQRGLRNGDLVRVESKTTPTPEQKKER